MSGRSINAIDTPWVINAACAVLVTGHAVATGAGWVPNVSEGFLKADLGIQAAIYIGLLGGAAIVSGFAGVIVVFGLSSTSDRFREFRVKGGKSLASNWASTSSSGLTAAALALVASVLVPTTLIFISPWLFELAVLLVVHSGVRLIWLLRGMVTIVRIDDIEYLKDKNKKPLDQVPWKK